MILFQDKIGGHIHWEAFRYSLKDDVPLQLPYTKVFVFSLTCKLFFAYRGHSNSSLYKDRVYSYD
jgi:hypothetical protein